MRSIRSTAVICIATVGKFHVEGQFVERCVSFAADAVGLLAVAGEWIALRCNCSGAGASRPVL